MLRPGHSGASAFTPRLNIRYAAMPSHLNSPRLLTVLLLTVSTSAYVGCSGSADKPAGSGTQRDSVHAQAPSAGALPAESAHEKPNADGIDPQKDETGTMLVGWDELVKHAPQYEGKRVHVKTLIGGTIPVDKKRATGYLYPIDMDKAMMQGLMEFITNNPESGTSMPLLCTFESRKEADKVAAGAVSVIEGKVKIVKKGVGTGFTIQRGIKEAYYVMMEHASVLH